jgi:hypothetical protein
MRIATCGGDTKWRGLVVAQLAATWVAHGRRAIIVDATPQQELIEILKVSPPIASRLPRLGEEGFRLKEYVQGGQSGLRASSITECSVPNALSRQVGCSPSDPLMSYYSGQVSCRIQSDANLESSPDAQNDLPARFISLGACEADDITSLSRHHQALSIFLNHLADASTDGVFIHLDAGQLPFIDGVLGRVDLAVIVEEGDMAGLPSMLETLRRFRTPAVVLRSQSFHAHTPPTERIEISLRMISSEGASIATAVRQGLTVYDAPPLIINHADTLRRDPSRMDRNNQAMAALTAPKATRVGARLPG